MYPMDYTHNMRVQMTEIYRDWINALRDRRIRARIQVGWTGWCMAIRASTATWAKA